MTRKATAAPAPAAPVTAPKAPGSKMWFGKLTGKRGAEVWVRVRRDGGLNAGDQARFGGTARVNAWFEVDAATVTAAKAALAAGNYRALGTAPAPVKAPRKARPGKPAPAPVAVKQEAVAA